MQIPKPPPGHRSRFAIVERGVVAYCECGWATIACDMVADVVRLVLDHEAAVDASDRHVSVDPAPRSKETRIRSIPDRG